MTTDDSPVPHWYAEKEHPTVLTLRIKAEGNRDWEAWYLLRSDAHHDNLHANHDLEREHLEEAKRRGAGILDFGDLFCVMQGKWDRRADTRQLRPELVCHDYTDRVVQYASDFYAPYAKHFTSLSPGNHETAFQSRHHTDLTSRLAQDLWSRGGSAVVMPYAGWVRFMFERGSQRQSVNLRYTHGHGGGAQVTKGTIQAQRAMANNDDVDIFVSGHNHQQWILAHTKNALTAQGEPYQKRVWLVKAGGYKDETSDGEGWAVERGHAPKPLGAIWLKFSYRKGKVHTECQFAA